MCVTYKKKHKKTLNKQSKMVFYFSLLSRQLKCQRSDGLTVSTGCKLLPSMYECDCTLSHATCIQKQYCMCDQGYFPQSDGNGGLIRCVYSNPTPSKTMKEKKGML